MDSLDTEPISQNWLKWIAHNLLLGVAPESICETLCNNGIPADLASKTVSDAQEHPFIEGARTLATQVAKRDWLLHNTRILRESGDTSIDETWDPISSSNFHQQYYSRNRPLLIRGGLKHWPALEKWNPDYLRGIAGTREVEIQANRESDPNYEINCLDHKKTMEFGEYVDLVFSATETNDYYMTANNSGINGTALADFWQDIEPLPDFLNPQQIEGRMFFWMGPKGTVTPVHHDLTNNLMVQICGRKRIKLIAPEYLPLVYNNRHCYSPVDLEAIDYDAFPLFKFVQIIDVTIGPGDMFFLPVGWWHHVRGLDPTITITCTNFRAANQYTDHYKTYGSI